MRYLVTGASGFIGSYVLRHLLDEPTPDSSEVAFLARGSSDLWRIRDLEGRAGRIEGDLERLGAAERAIASFRPDAVVHLGWWGVGGANRNDPRQIQNLHATLELVRIVRLAGARHFVGLGSQAEYGPSTGALDETAPTNPTSLYGAAKLSTYHLARQPTAGSAMRFSWVRVFSTYGPADGPEWMIPSLIRQLLDRKRPALTLGEQRWDYLHVADAAAAIVVVARSAAAVGAFNLGSGEAHTIRSVVERLRDAIDPALPLGFGEVPYRPDQVMHLEARIDRLRSLGWSPRIPLDRGLAETVAYYRRGQAR